MSYNIGDEVSVFFKREWWNGTVLEKDIVWDREHRDYVVLVTNPDIGGLLQTPYYKDDNLVGYLVYSSAKGVERPKEDKRKEKVLGCFKNLLVIDPQEDCECETEIYDAGDFQRLVWLRDGVPEVVECNSDRICLPMSKQINFEQIKQCVLTSLPFAQPVTSHDDPYTLALMHPEIKVNELPNEVRKILAPFRADWCIVRLPEIPKNKIYFSPYQEFLGCFTWNISRYGMFIIPDNFRYCVI